MSTDYDPSMRSFWEAVTQSHRESIPAMIRPSREPLFHANRRGMSLSEHIPLEVSRWFGLPFRRWPQGEEDSIFERNKLFDLTSSSNIRRQLPKQSSKDSVECYFLVNLVIANSCAHELRWYRKVERLKNPRPSDARWKKIRAVETLIYALNNNICILRTAVRTRRESSWVQKRNKFHVQKKDRRSRSEKTT